MKTILHAVLILYSGSVFSAPFCVVTNWGTNCYYYNMESCRQAAGTQGACIINQDEVQRPTSGAPFCVVSAYATNCWYYNAQSCRQAASSSGGACVVNPDR